MYLAVVDSSSNNIPTTFDTSAGSLIVDGAPNASELSFINGTSGVVVGTINAKNQAVPSSTVATNRRCFMVAPSTSSMQNMLHLKVEPGDQIYIRSDTGSALSSGKFYIHLR